MLQINLLCKWEMGLLNFFRLISGLTRLDICKLFVLTIRILSSSYGGFQSSRNFFGLIVKGQHTNFGGINFSVNTDHLNSFTSVMSQVT